MQQSERQPGHRYCCNGNSHNFPGSPARKSQGSLTRVCMALSPEVGFFIPGRAGMQAGLQQASWYVYFSKSRSSCSATYSTPCSQPAPRSPPCQPAARGPARPSSPAGQRRWEAEPRSTFGAGGKTKISQTFHRVTKQIL